MAINSSKGTTCVYTMLTTMLLYDRKITYMIYTMCLYGLFVGYNFYYN